MALRSVNDPEYTNPYGIGAQEADIARSKKLIDQRKANEAQLIAEQAKYSRQEQKRLEADAAAAAAAGSPDAAAKAAAAKQYADEKASVAADLEQNGRLLTETEKGLQEHEATLARMQAKEASIPPNVKIVNAGSDPAAQSPPTVPALNETTPSSSSPTQVPADQVAGFRIDQVNNAPLSAPVPTDVNPLGPVTNVDLTRQPELVPLEPGNSNPLPPVTNVVVQPELVPLEPGNNNPLPPVANVVVEPPPVPVDLETVPDSANRTSSYTGTPPPVDPAVDPGARSPFGGGAFNDAAARNPEAAVDAVAAAEAAQQRATEQRLQEQQAIQAQFQSPANGDWRVKLKLSPNATYLYKDNSANSILAPLAASDGVVFPYMPDIQTTYNANYDTTDLTHSNYRGYFYKSSYVGDINITGTFTAQNTAEANYLLAVIHFFRSATKMFYGEKDSFRGAPPPLVYLFGLGQYQFNAHPCVIRSFNYSLPNDVDYIRTKPNNYNVNLNNTLPKTESGGNPISAVIGRLRNALLPKGALPNVPQELITVSQSVSNIDNSTYVPTKITVTISLLPIQTRNQQSQQFSVKGFANGDLLKGGFW